MNVGEVGAIIAALWRLEHALLLVALPQHGEPCSCEKCALVKAQLTKVMA